MIRGGRVGGRMVVMESEEEGLVRFCGWLSTT